MIHLHRSSCDVIIRKGNKIVIWCEDITDITSGAVLLSNDMYMPTYHLHRLNAQGFIFAYYVDIETIPEIRSWVIGLIEGITGTLKSVPYNLISTDDLIKWYNAIC